MSVLNNEHIVLADKFRTKRSELSVLQADKSIIEQFNKAHDVLERASRSWRSARDAAVKGDSATALAEVTETRRLTDQAKRDLEKVGQDAVSADSSKVSSPATSSPEPKPAPAPSPSPAPKPAPSPKKDDVEQPAQADQVADADKDAKVVDPEMIKNRHSDESFAQALNGKFSEIDGRLDAIPAEFIELFGRYSAQDLERVLKIGNRVNGMFHRKNPHGKHTNRHDREEHYDEHSHEHHEEHHEEQADDHASSDPQTKVHNFGADRKATPQHERN
jgi:hypothetical protein